MRGKKKKGVMVKPGAEAAVAAAMIEKLKLQGVNIPAASDNADTVSMNQSEYTYYSETTNEDTVASKVDERKQDPGVGVSLKDINIEASLEPHDKNISPKPNSKIIDVTKLSADKRNVTPSTSRPISTEL